MAQSCIRVSLPSNSQALTRLPQERREAFETHLRAIVAEASESTIDPPDDPPSVRGAGRNPVSKLLKRACGVCRGWCCYKAGDQHAYLTPESIQAYRLLNPGASNDEVVAAYLDWIPEESYEGSCVFHGRHGCGLPESMRSEICGWYLCEALIDLSRRAALQDRATVFATAMQGPGTDRLAVFDADGVHWVSPSWDPSSSNV